MLITIKQQAAIVREEWQELNCSISTGEFWGSFSKLMDMIEGKYKYEPEKREPKWFTPLYKEIAEYNIRTGKKIQILDILEMFFVESITQVDEEDRELFIKRVRERLV